MSRTCSVSCPPSSKPTYPGGAPISLATACFSMYSDMSSRTYDTHQQHIAHTCQHQSFHTTCLHHDILGSA